VKIASLEIGGVPRVGLVTGEEVVDLTSESDGALDEVVKFLALGPVASKELADRCLRRAKTRLSIQGVKFLAPVRSADKILGVGMNYHSFVAAAERLGLPLPKSLLWFQRPRACLAGPTDDVWLPRGATDLDYEAELAVVIGRRCRRVAAKDAAHVIAGFTVANDLTLRDRVLKSVPLGKSFDTHTPTGPWITSLDEVGDPHRLDIRSWVNGELRQESNTSDMMSSCYALIEELSTVCTLNPGDILLTGTPDGSGIFCKPPQSLRVGDSVRIEIERIGTIENRIVDEPPIE
jgi:2-keto-4-pentenoate hydratase/2-oxohepta-3-ene-1,7-dioic acid hydratase in catechol pathway